MSTPAHLGVTAAHLSTRRAVLGSPSVVLFLALFASQAAVLVLSPILGDVADEFGVSIAAAGQVRFLAAPLAAVVALVAGKALARFSPRSLLAVGAALVGAGSVGSAAAPSFTLLALAQVPTWAGARWNPSGVAGVHTAFERRRSLVRKSLIIAAAVALVSASTALAGGWATVKLSSSPKGLSAGEPWVVDITVLQHGLATQPLCCLKPTVTIRRVAPFRSTSAAVKRSFTINARPTSRTGVYRARVVFPSAGTWRYEVYDAFTTYGGARTHRFAAVKIAQDRP